jgi:nicotinate-nucleotide adenylyltransferase
MGSSERIESLEEAATRPPLRIGLYGGTFDPIHHGHLILARDAVELLALDRLIFLPAAISPHKLASDPTPAEIRRDLLGAAMNGESGFSLDDREIYRDGPSYTVETVEALRGEMPGAEYVYLIGEDHLPKLSTWHRFEELRGMVEFVVFGRGQHLAGTESFRRIERRLDISATEIRARVARGASIRYLVPETVHKIIEQHHLYQGAPY